MDTSLISGHTKLVGLMGWPLGHSLSPVMHNAAFTDLNMDWLYLPLPVRLGDVVHAVRGVDALNFVGCNVTVPHKQAVFSVLDEISREAQIIGAVNTIHFLNGISIGINTDAAGFIKSLNESGCYPRGKRVLILGAGGAARAVAYALAKAQVDSISICNRTDDRVDRLIVDMAGFFPDCFFDHISFTPEALAIITDQVDIIINATSVGMAPHIDACPWPNEVPMPANAIFIDLVYNPLETVFLARAKESGAITVDGLGMLVHQGALAFEVWTGRCAPIRVMRQSCLNVLSDLRSNNLSDQAPSGGQ